MTSIDVEATVRLDKWLWAARLYKTRSLAQKACATGHVKVDGASAKPSKPVRPGDEIEALTTAGRRIVCVRSLAERRGPAAAARALYEDRTPPPEPGELEGRMPWRERGAGRPTKRDRRRLARLRGR